MSAHGYKKYMKKDARTNSQGSPLIQVFVFSFFGMLLLFTLIISYVSKTMTVDTSIGEYREQQIDDMEDKKIIDVNRLEMIKNEDQGRNFSDIMQTAEDTKPVFSADNPDRLQTDQNDIQTAQDSKSAPVPLQETFYKVYIGSYTSAEQAKVAKEIIMESGSALNPIVKQVGSNEYTLQVGIFKSKQSAETLLNTIKNNNLPGRIVKGE